MANSRCRTSSPKAVTNLARLSPIAQALGQPFAQPELLIDGLEQQRSTVRAAVFLVEGRHDGLRKEVGKRNSLCGRVRHYEEALVGVKRVLQHVSTAIGAFFNSRTRLLHE